MATLELIVSSPARHALDFEVPIVADGSRDVTLAQSDPMGPLSGRA